ncbi:MAG: hypothetical protein PHY45_09655 [Rhodocyclaceae bacterium]|nr:hypothetical protein [Rhodocyclaceae bacterium]
MGFRKWTRVCIVMGAIFRHFMEIIKIVHIDENRERMTDPISPDTLLDRVGLRYVWRVLSSCKTCITVIPLVSIAVGIVASTQFLPLWEARVTIQIGQIGQPSMAGGHAEPTLIESAPQVLARIKDPGFQNIVLTDMAVPLDQENLEATIFRHSIRANLTAANSNFIEFRVRGRSREEANRFAEAVVKRLSNAHQQLAQSSIQRLSRQLESIRVHVADLSRAHKILVDILRRQDSNANPRPGLLETLFQTSIANGLDSNLRGWEELELAYEEQLSPMRTYPTTAFSSYINDKPVAPEKLTIVFMAGVIGLIVGIITAFLLKARTRVALNGK